MTAKFFAPMRALLDYFRIYADQGRLRSLAWFVAASWGIAFVEWSLSPGVVFRWWPEIAVSDRLFFTVLPSLALAWTVVVVIGLKVCGWPGVIMLLSAKWGLFPLYIIAALLWACTRGDCI